jgi:BASS family bile acid:Na+ symporter
MLARHRWGAWARAFEPRATRIATVLFVLIVVAAVAQKLGALGDNFTSLAPFAVVLNVSMLGVGFGVAPGGTAYRAANRSRWALKPPCKTRPWRW